MEKKNLRILLILSLFAVSLSSCGTVVSSSGSYESLSTSEISTSCTTSATVSSSTQASSGSWDEDLATQYDGFYKPIADNLSSMTGGLNGGLRQKLTSYIQPKSQIAYSAGLASFLQSADEDPNNSSNMLYFYTQASIKKNSASTWNREHCWPQSLSKNSSGNQLYGKTGGGCDALHIRPTYYATNEKRGNHKYGVSSNRTMLKCNGYDFGYLDSSNDVFEPLDIIKGDCARIILYMWVAYLATHGTAITKVATSIALMVKWSNEDQPSASEKLRNDRVQAGVQKNRNPFVDHPEWVNLIFA